MPAVLRDWRVIVCDTGRILIGVALLMLVSGIVGIAEGDLRSFAIFLFSAGLTASVACAMALWAGRRTSSPAGFRW